MRTDYPASDRQIEYIHDLFDNRNLFADPEFFDRVNAMDSGEYDRYLESLKAQAGTLGDPTKRRVSSERASQIIERLKALPKKPRDSQGTEYAHSALAEPEAGMYKTGNDDSQRIFRVYLGQQSGKMLVKEVVGDDDHGYEYEYRGAANGRARSLLRGSERLSLEEAKSWGKMTGHCCVCARRLDNPESMDAGIGPVCAGRLEV